MENEENVIATYTAKVAMLEEQRSWMQSMAQQAGVEEHRRRCHELAQKLARKIESLRQRIADLQPRTSAG